MRYLPNATANIHLRFRPAQVTQGLCEGLNDGLSLPYESTGTVSTMGGWPGRTWSSGPSAPGSGCLLRQPPQLERTWDAWQAERYQRGEISQRHGYTDNPFRPR